MSFYADRAAKASKLLARRGQVGQVKRVTKSGGGPSDPNGGAETTTLHDARLVVFPVSDDRIDGTNILTGDFQVICEAIGFEVTPDDRMICSEGELTIKRLGKIAPAGETVAYDMVCRK